MVEVPVPSFHPAIKLCMRKAASSTPPCYLPASALKDGKPKSIPVASTWQEGTVKWNVVREATWAQISVAARIQYI